MKKEKLVMNINHIIANELSVKLWQVDAAIKLIDEAKDCSSVHSRMLFSHISRTSSSCCSKNALWMSDRLICATGMHPLRSSSDSRYSYVTRSTSSAFAGQNQRFVARSSSQHLQKMQQLERFDSLIGCTSSPPHELFFA